MTNEPVMTLVVALIAAGAGLLAAFGVDVTAEQTAALSAFAVAALGLGVWVRSKVFPVARARGKLADERGQAEPVTLLIYVIVAVILIVVLFKVLERL